LVVEIQKIMIEHRANCIKIKPFVLLYVYLQFLTMLCTSETGN